MKKRFNLSFILIGVLMVIMMPYKTWAASYSFDKNNVTKEDGTTKILVNINVDGSEAITSGKLVCNAPSTEVLCEIEPIEGEFSGERENSNSTYVYAPMLTAGETLAPGSHGLAYVVLKNISSSKQSITINLSGSTINDAAQNASISTEVKVVKQETPKSNDATIKSLKYSQGKMVPEFSKDVTEYTIYGIADTVNSIRLTPTMNDEGATFNITGGKSTSGTSVTLNQGENKVIIEGQASNGTTLNYTFTIYRGETNFNSAKLESLSIGNYTLTPAFSSDVYEYTLTVPNTVTTIQDILTYKTQDEKASSVVKGVDNFVVGSNTFTIIVDSATGDETVTYKVVINRLSEENIEVLKYINNEVTFKDADGVQTTLKIDEFQRTYPGEYQKIINKEYNFDADGNIIIVTEDDKKDEEETKDEKNNSKTWLIVVLVLVGLLIIGIAGVLIFRKKDNDTDPKKKKDKDKDKDSSKDEEKEEKEENKDDEEESKDDEKEEKNFDEFSKDENATVDIDEALSDLMNTKQYIFQDEDEENKKHDEDYKVITPFFFWQLIPAIKSPCKRE